MNVTILNSKQQAKIQLKAAKDSDFRRRLTAKPKAMIEKELDLSLPEDLSIEVIEATEKSLVLIIPPKPEDFCEGMTAGRWLESQREELFVANEHPVAQGQARLFAKSWENDEFKQRLLKDPHQTIADEFSVTLPEGITIRAREETGSHAIFLLPVFSKGDELKIEELEDFGGATIPTPTSLTIAAAVSSASASVLMAGSPVGAVIASVSIANPGGW